MCHVLLWFCCLVFIHNHKLNSTIQLDLEGNKKNMEQRVASTAQRL
jgi:hypothetical protein